MRMTLLAAAAACVVAWSIEPAVAQTAYEQGNRDGYNDTPPPNGTPGKFSDYAHGYRDGQDDADADEAQQQKWVRDMDTPPPVAVPALPVAPGEPADLVPPSPVAPAPATPPVPAPETTTDTDAER